MNDPKLIREIATSIVHVATAIAEYNDLKRKVIARGKPWKHDNIGQQLDSLLQKVTRISRDLQNVNGDLDQLSLEWCDETETTFRELPAFILAAYGQLAPEL